ncbi:uncharacterized protein LOC109846018 [Asparagus officinalis]|uniref:uncharacterized protein LOC109846018 n=1 Tax=Asparagus officinalis TaxID=4686 RepID=UPI00098E3E11|nr:uncharacterized protein LOC109846018 [Asparagus officinalis]
MDEERELLDNFWKEKNMAAETLVWSSRDVLITRKDALKERQLVATLIEMRPNYAKDIHICSPWVTRCINENNPSSVDRMFKPITTTRFQELDKIIFPLLTSFHWHMLVFSVKDRRFYHYSSLRGYMSYASEFRVKLISTIPDTWNLDITSCQEVETVDVPQQHGSLDCAVFLMAYMFSLISGQTISIDQKDCARHRARIVALFLSEGNQHDPQDQFSGC